MALLCIAFQMLERKWMKNKFNKKRIIIVISIIGGLLILIFLGILIPNIKNDQVLRSHMDAANRYLIEMDYEQAIVELVLALEIEPNNQRTLEALEDAYLAYAQSYIEKEQYDDAVRVLQEGLALLSSEKMQELFEATQKKAEIKEFLLSAKNLQNQGAFIESLKIYDKLLQITE